MLASIKKMIRKRSQIYITYFNEGLAEFLNGNSERAILLFDEGLEIENSYFPLWHAKGVVLLCERRYEDAIICFRAAINLKSLSLTALMGLGIAHAKLQQITEAAEYYRQIQIRAPRVENITNNLYCRKYVIHATLERFWLTLEQNHLSTVLNFCNQTLAIPTEQVNISINGYTRHYSSNFFESVKIKAKIFKGYILLLQGQWQEALQQFEESPERLPLGDLTSNYFDGDTHWWAPEELFSFQSFNELGERETYLAFAKKGLGRLDEARIHFQNALMSNPLAMRAKIGLGSLLLLQNNWIEARNYFNDMLAANNNSINALNYKAFALLNNNEINEARDCFERAYQLNNQSAMAVFGRSLIANANQNLEEANRNYEQAVTILNARPEYIAEQLEYYWLYGKSCITLRMFDRARTVFERMLQLKPNYVHAQRAMTELGEVQLNHQQQQTPVNDHAEIQILARSLEQSINNNEALATANTQLEVRVTQLEERIAQLNQEITI